MWEFRGDDGSWEPMRGPSHDANEITPPAGPPGAAYTFDLAAKTQQNVATKAVRHIRRVAVPPCRWSQLEESNVWLMEALCAQGRQREAAAELLLLRAARPQPSPPFPHRHHRLCGCYREAVRQGLPKSSGSDPARRPWR